MKIVFSKTDYRPLKKGETYANKFVILSTKQFKPEYREAKCQLFFAESGFGCDPEKLGGKIFGRFYDERSSTRREYVLGVATEEAIQEWEKFYGLSRDAFNDSIKSDV